MRDELALRGRPAQKNDYVVKKYYHRSGHSLGESGKDPIDSYRTASQEKLTYTYVDEACVQRIGWPTSSHHEEHTDDDYYDSFPMLKRWYSELVSNFDFICHLKKHFSFHSLMSLMRYTCKSV